LVVGGWWLLVTGLAMLQFLAAASGGFWMAWPILAGDVRGRR
jgi:hypothetical protein